MKLPALALCLALALSGCATVRRHPVLTGVVVGILATSIALSASQDREHRAAHRFDPVCGSACAVGYYPPPSTIGN